MPHCICLQAKIQLFDKFIMCSMMGNTPIAGNFPVYMRWNASLETQAGVASPLESCPVYHGFN